MITKGIQYIEKLTVHGLLKDSEAEEIVEELEVLLEHVISCNLSHHEGEMDLQVDDEGKSCSLLPDPKKEETAPEDDAAKYSGIAASPIDLPTNDEDLTKVDEEIVAAEA